MEDLMKQDEADPKLRWADRALRDVRDPRAAECARSPENFVRRSNQSAVWYTCAVCHLRTCYISRVCASGASRAAGSLYSDVPAYLLSAHATHAAKMLLAAGLTEAGLNVAELQPAISPALMTGASPASSWASSVTSWSGAEESGDA